MSRTIRKSNRHIIVVLLCSKGKYSVSQFIVKQKQRLKGLDIIRSSLYEKRRTKEKIPCISFDRKYYTNTRKKKQNANLFNTISLKNSVVI